MLLAALLDSQNRLGQSAAQHCAYEDQARLELATLQQELQHALSMLSEKVRLSEQLLVDF